MLIFSTLLYKILPEISCRRAKKIILYCITMGSTNLTFPPYEQQHGGGAGFLHILEMQQSQKHIWGYHAGSQRGGG